MKFGRMKSVLLCILLSGCTSDLIWAQKVSGRVFLDANRNGVYDKKERVLKDVLLSNGKDIVKSDKRGQYTVKAGPGQSIFPILPSGYGLSNASTSIGNAKFFYIDPTVNYGQVITLDVALIAEEQPQRFRIGAIGDIQVDTEEELEYAAKSILSELDQRKDIAFNMLLGDLVNDNMALLPFMRQALDKTTGRYWTMVGNHDRNTNSTFLTYVFQRQLGAETYAFNYAGVHFIVLNNVFATGRKSYEGRVSPEQLAFLAEDLKHVPKNTTIVLSQHIPMAHTRNQKEVLSLLDGFKKVLVLTGHTHTVNRYFFESDAVHELGAGATCGNWWRGEKDLDGVPQALMQCGAPRGYFTVDFENGDYKIAFKGIGLDATQQMRLGLEKDSLVVNIFAGSAKTKVELQIDSSDWLTMDKLKKLDPTVGAVRTKNNNKIYPTAGNSRNPLGLRESSHVWGLAVPQAYKGKLCVVRLRAKDDFGYAADQVFMLRL